MKRFLVSIAVVFFVFAGALSAQAAPSYGWHGDAQGNGELVLDYQHARDLANSLGGSYYDPNVKRTIDGVVFWATQVGGRAVPVANFFYGVTNLVLSANKLQMKEATAAPNYEAYGFKMKLWVPYWCTRYSFNDGTLLREDGNAAVYVVVADAKFWVPNGSFFNYEWYRIRIVPRGRLSGWYPYPKTGVLLKEKNNPAVNLIAYGTINPQYTWVSSLNQQGFVRRVVSYNAFVRLGLSWSSVRTVPDGAFYSPNPYLPRGYDLL
jgi:hypothetical protein